MTDRPRAPWSWCPMWNERSYSGRCTIQKGFVVGGDGRDCHECSGTCTLQPRKGRISARLRMQTKWVICKSFPLFDLLSWKEIPPNIILPPCSFDQKFYSDLMRMPPTLSLVAWSSADAAIPPPTACTTREIISYTNVCEIWCVEVVTSGTYTGQENSRI